LTERLEGRISHYEILAPLGAGGMGAVYRARDERLGRDVALKVLLARDTADPTARVRLIREAQTASSLNHPHLAHIYEVGEDRGHVFIAMELVEGRTLQRAIPPGGLPAEAVLRIGREIAEALAYAHDHGVIHRDLKSTNVMLTADERVKILDFGLAKRAPDAAGRDTTHDLSLTEPGMVMGTPNHLAPEVLRGANADARSDVWALGIVLYEMASGRFPFAGGSLADLAAAIVSTEPTPLSGRVPLGLQSVIARCLAKEPSRRYARAGDVRAALDALHSGVLHRPVSAPPHRALILGSGILVIAAIAALAWFPGGLRERFAGAGARVSDGRPVIRSLAVLPLANLSGDPSQEYFADGMTEELITDLAPIPSLKVISRTSVMRFKGSKLTLPQIAKELGVDAIVEGSVLRAGDRVRVTAQLIHAASDHHLWARSFERDFREVLTLQSEVASDIANEIRMKVTPHVSEQLATRRMVHPEAYELYLRGRHAWNQASPGSVQQSIELFEKAAALDPRDARYPSGLADAILLQVQMLGTVPPAEGMAKVKEYARRALDLDPNSAEARASYAASLVFGEWNWREAEREIDRAISINPGYASAHLIRSVVLAVTDRIDESIDSNRRALELDPYSLLNLWHGIVTHRAAHRYEAALSLAARARAAYPGAPLILEAETRIHEQRGDFDKAVELVATMLADTPDGALWTERLRAAYRKEGPAGYWRVAIEYTRAREPGPAAAMALAHHYAGAGDRARALDQLEAAYRAHTSDLLFIQAEPIFDPLRREPRFRALVEKLGLPPAS